MQVTPVTTLTLDDQQINVSDCSDKVKNLVAIYNDWRQKEADAHSDYMMAQTALRGLTNDIIAVVKEELTPAEEPVVPADSSVVDATPTTTDAPSA